ncbi:MAG: HAD family hydrolase [Candidatus Rokubacteria bacterium]|nr:HAD family hydrolase [Candidatus Rokubacteria bacterium]
MAGRFDLVIFDNDGVLVDSEWHANGILADLLCEAGLPSTRESCIADYMGSSMSRVRTLAEARLGRPLPADLEARYHERLFEVFRTRLAAVPGVEDAIARIPLPRCVASSGTHERIRLALGTTGLLRHFEGRLFSTQDVTRGKPEPDLFLHVAKTLGADAARCAVIEDSPLGVEAANRAGMTAFGFARMTPAARLRDATGGVFASMDELPALLASP